MEHELIGAWEVIDTRAHEELSASMRCLLIITTHRQGDDVFCDLAGPKCTHHRQKSASVHPLN